MCKKVSKVKVLVTMEAETRDVGRVLATAEGRTLPNLMAFLLQRYLVEKER